MSTEDRVSFIEHVMNKQNPDTCAANFGGEHPDDYCTADRKCSAHRPPVVVPHINEHAARAHRPIAAPAPAVGWDGPTRILRSTDARDNADHDRARSETPTGPTGRGTRTPAGVPEWVYTNISLVVAPVRYRSPEDVQADPEIRLAIERAYWLGVYSGAHGEEAAADLEELYRRIATVERIVGDIWRERMP